jgi:hypothetical protein
VTEDEAEVAGGGGGEGEMEREVDPLISLASCTGDVAPYRASTVVFSSQSQSEEKRDYSRPKIARKTAKKIEVHTNSKTAGMASPKLQTQREDTPRLLSHTRSRAPPQRKREKSKGEKPLR